MGIEGVSRYGKAELMTMAFDTRFSLGLIASSGEAGVKLGRGYWDELLRRYFIPCADRLGHKPSGR